MKYLKYYISPFTILVALFVMIQGKYFPTFFLLGFSLFIILGDYFVKEGGFEKKYSYPFLLNLPMYINLPLLTAFIFFAIFSISPNSQFMSSSIINLDIYIELDRIRQSYALIDMFSIVFLSGLIVGISGTVPGHELVHRTKSKLDMFFGNWLLAYSWDCTFAVEHVYGHHKNVATGIDPATGKRGENIYKFILKAMYTEHRDAWIIELSRLKLNKIARSSFKNRMLIGYLRSIAITLCGYFIGGLPGVISFFVIAFVAKSLLELINFTEHYGLVRVPGEPVMPRHSWNSNASLSSIYLFNVTRHSSHHEKSHLKYWELKTYKDAPKMPQGYLTMIYIGLVTPFFFHRMMAKKLLEWDQIYASQEELKLAKKQNSTSGVPLLLNTV